MEFKEKIKEICNKVISGEYNILEFARRLETIMIDDTRSYNGINDTINDILYKIEMDIFCMSSAEQKSNIIEYSYKLLSMLD